MMGAHLFLVDDRSRIQDSNPLFLAPLCLRVVYPACRHRWSGISRSLLYGDIHYYLMSTSELFFWHEVGFVGDVEWSSRLLCWTYDIIFQRCYCSLQYTVSARSRGNPGRIIFYRKLGLDGRLLRYCCFGSSRGGCRIRAARASGRLYPSTL